MLPQGPYSWRHCRRRRISYPAVMNKAPVCYDIVNFVLVPTSPRALSALLLPQEAMLIPHFLERFIPDTYLLSPWCNLCALPCSLLRSIWCKMCAFVMLSFGHSTAKAFTLIIVFKYFHYNNRKCNKYTLSISIYPRFPYRFCFECFVYLLCWKEPKIASYLCVIVLLFWATTYDVIWMWKQP